MNKPQIKRIKVLTEKMIKALRRGNMIAAYGYNADIDKELEACKSK